MSSLYELTPDRRKGSGNWMNGLAGEPLGNRKLVYRHASGTWRLADADAVATMPAIGLTMHTAGTGKKVRILLDGFIGLGTWTWTTGGGASVIYASTTPGELTQTPPAGMGDVVQAVAWAWSSNLIYFDPLPPSGGIAGVTKEEYYPPVESDAYIGQHYGAQMLDGVETIVGFEFMIPNDLHTLVSVVVMVVQDTAAAPNMVWNATTDFAEACSTEDYDTHEDSVGVQTSLVTQKDIVCLDVSAALTGIAAGDLVGMEFLRDGDAGGDTVGGPVYCLGLRLRYR